MAEKIVVILNPNDYVNCFIDNLVDSGYPVASTLADTETVIIAIALNCLGGGIKRQRVRQLVSYLQSLQVPPIAVENALTVAGAKMANELATLTEQDMVLGRFQWDYIDEELFIFKER